LSDKSVLVVDDSAIMREVIAMNLKRLLKVSVVEAQNGLEAFTRLEQGPFNLILTDLIMPEMDGLQFVRLARARLKHEIPIVVITTRGEIKDRDLALSLGANAYLTKPLNVIDLIRTTLKFIGRRETHGLTENARP